MFPSFAFDLTIKGPEHDVAAFVGTVELARAGDVIRFDSPPWSPAVRRDEATVADGAADIEVTLRDIVQGALGGARVEQGPTRVGRRGATYGLQVLEVPLFELEQTSRRHRSLMFIGRYELAGRPMEVRWSGGRSELAGVPASART